jgi:ATP-dependent protease HslVU (ClpYQ) peptidase subunit
MTVIAWDGKTLAADRQTTIAGARFTSQKIFRINGELLGFSGGQPHGMRLLDWALTGFEPATYPVEPDDDRSGLILRITRDRRIMRYDNAFPCIYEDEFYATGSGRDFALGALAAGKDAVGAVEIAIRFSTECGMGIDTLDL